MDDEQQVTLRAPDLATQPVSVTRKMAAALPELRRTAEASGLTIHHLGAGYPNPEVTDPRGFLAGEAAFYEHLRAREGINDPQALPEFLRESYAYTDTLGPVGPRESFARVYGADWDVKIDPQRLIPTVGATGGISLMCALFERRACAVLSVARSTLGYQARLQQRDAPALAVMRELADQYPRYGYRKIRIFLARRGHPMSAERTYRLWRQAGLQVPRRRPRGITCGPMISSSTRARMAGR